MMIGIVLLALVILFAVFGSSWFKGTHSTREDRESPLEILDRRYAEGEIGEAEYVRKKEDITRQDR
ncbi:MAG: SHOCT domain-containing protein [Sphaerochaetaceae bacterium]|nr:SHOCT domain-containing protein [Sphaerochaetaceae bacterium]